MATSTQHAFLTLEEYLHTSYRPDCDYIDGEVRERNLGEFEHGTIQLAFGSCFFTHATEWNIRATTEQRVRVSKSRVRIPDVCVVHRDLPREKIIVTAPLICIEILSPEDRVQRILERLEDYRLMGVPNIWLADPIQRTVFVYNETGLHPYTEKILKITGTEISVNLAEIFSALD